MNKIVNGLKKYMYVVAIFLTMSVILSISFSNFIVTSNNHKAAEMYIGELKYSLEIDGSSTNTLTVPTGETIIDVKVNNLNPVDTYYKLLYLNNSNLEIKYFSETKDTDEVKTSYKNPNDSVTSSNTNILKLFIRNNSTTSQNVSFSLKGGYINNTLSDISVPSGYSEITTIEVPSSNTYFCKTNDTLTSGLEYVNGQYTYRYRREGEYVSSGLAWDYISNDGWGVQLTDKTSTDAVTSKLCTYVNNKSIVSMGYMFYNSKATTINLSNFDTSNVTNMNGMFRDSQATTLDLSGFDTSNVTDMELMFSNSQATPLDVSNFDTSKVTDMSFMFRDSQATTLDLSNFDTSNVTSMFHMFNGSKAAILDVSNFDTSNVISMESIFYESQATTLDVSNFDTSNVVNMGSMFYNSQATTLDVSNFDTSNVTDMSGMFNGSNATTLDVSNFDTSNVTDMSRMFSNSQTTTLDVSNFDTSNVTDMSWMFYKSQATTLDVSNFDTSNVTNMSQMFSGSKATTLDVSNFDTSNVTAMEGMFSSSKATTLDLSSFDINKVNNVQFMFRNCKDLKTIYVSNKFNTDAVIYSFNMFYNCTSLVGGAGTTYDSTKTDKTYARIDGGTSNPGYFTDIADKDIPAPNSFSTDSWKTIVKAVKNNDISKYNVGDTKEVDLGTTYGTHTLRIANTSTPSECSTSGFSQTACGFVLEFADIITEHTMNDKYTNVGGWPASDMRTFVNNDIYDSLPSDLKNGIIDTTVISSYGSSDSSNFTSIDKLYLLAPKEIYSNWNNSYDTAIDLTRQLDYYKNEGVTESNYSKVIKMYNSTTTRWWLRSAHSSSYNIFYFVFIEGYLSNSAAYGTHGVSPAFRIG